MGSCRAETRIAILMSCVGILGVGGCESRRVQDTVLKSPSNESLPARHAEDSWLQLESEEFDFGQTLLLPDQVARKVLRIKNTGSGTLTFKEPAVSCGCATAELSKLSLPSNDVAELAVVLRPTTYGPMVHRVMLSSNDVARPIVEFRVVGELVQRVQSEPRQLELGEIARGAPVERLVWVEVGLLRSEKDAPPVTVVPDSKAFALDPTGEVETVVKNGISRTRSAFRLRVSAGPEVGEARSYVDFHTPDATYRMPVTWSQPSYIDVSPRPLTVNGPAGKTHSASAVLKYLSPPSQPPAVLEQSVRNATVDATVSQTSDPSRFQLTVSILPAADAKFVSGSIEIETFDPNEPRIKVPVYGLVRAQ